MEKRWLMDVFRDGKWSKEPPENLTADELCDVLEDISFSHAEWVTERDLGRWRSAIAEAAARLRKHEKEKVEMQERVRGLLKELGRGEDGDAAEI